jgi:WD40 repeat protein
MNFSQPLQSWLGQTIDDRQRYLLNQRIGGGGMGEVFLATDTLLGQSVALKLLNSKLANEQMRYRFEQEVAVSAALRSNHIVQVFDYGVTAEGYPFYVMEYLCGQTLGQLLKREKRLSIDRTVNIITQVCAGLSLAHQGVYLRWKGDKPGSSRDVVKVIHRDLKPDNIFLLPTSLGEFVKILDFGIAKIRTEHPDYTYATNMFMGTYQYASPEQLRAEKNLDARADIYSLGVILYKMLSGAPPFQFELEHQSEIQPSAAVWAAAHLTKPPIPLRDQPGCDHISPMLEAVVMRCLSKAPSQRFSSVLELTQALHTAVGLPDPEAIEATHAGQLPIIAQPAPLPLPSLSPPIEPELSDSPTEESCYHTAQEVVSGEKERETRRFSRSVVLLTLSGLTIAMALGTRVHSLWSAASLSLSNDLAGDSPITASQDGRGASSAPLNRSGHSPTVRTITTATQLLTGHTDTVWDVEISPDGRTVVSGSFDKSIRFWDVQTGNLKQTLLGHTDAVRAIAFSPNGTILASGSGDKTIKLWDLPTGKLRHTLLGHSAAVWSVAISPDGQTLASGGYDGVVKTWNVQTGELLQTFPEHYDSIWSVAISPDGQTLASGSYGGTIQIWELSTGRVIRTLAAHTDAVRSIDISADGRTLVSGSWDKTIKVWDLQTGELRHTLTGHSDRVLSVAISPNNQTVASSGIDRRIHLWNLQTGTLQHTLTGHSDWVIAVAFSPDGNQLVSGSKDKSIRLWQW